MQIHEQTEGAILAISIEGRLDGTTSPMLDEKWKTVFTDTPVRMVLDLSKLEYVSSAGLRSILQAVKKTAASGGKLAACGVQPSVMEIFEISGFPGILKICPDRAGAFAEASS